jgi:predicted unusual protein kinase regulating ubiquinone biosynthesis (AarF/ABC1/UbiB family)
VGWLGAASGLERFLSFRFDSGEGHRAESLTPAERVRLALDELGATFIKQGLAQEFAQTLRSELNYLQEARNAESFAQNFADDPKVHIDFGMVGAVDERLQEQLAARRMFFSLG